MIPIIGNLRKGKELMAEINILSGQPVGKMQAERREEIRIRDQMAVEKSLETFEALGSPDGKIFYEKVRSVLADRITILVRQDPECQGLLKILDEIGTEIEMGRMSAERIAKQSLRMPTN